VLGGFTPQSAICQEYGSPDTPFLSWLNRGSETQGATRVLVIRNADTSFVYFSTQDGLIAPVPAEDYNGRSHDFSESATLQGAEQVDLTGQGLYDSILGTAHLGILNSPQSWRLALDFIAGPSHRRNRLSAGPRALTGPRDDRMDQRRARPGGWCPSALGGRWDCWGSPVCWSGCVSGGGCAGVVG
jgi:hypothetical protein